MKKLNLYTSCLVVILSINNINFAETEKELDFWLEMDKDFAEMSKRMERIQRSFLDDTDDKMKTKRSNWLTTELKENDDSIELIFNLPDSNLKTGDVQLEANGKNLKGSFIYNENQVNFSIKNGIQLKIWTSSKKETKEENDKMHSYFVSTSSSMNTKRLPRNVEHLENSEATFAKELVKDTDGKEIEKLKLKVILPASKKVESKSNWQQIKVKEENKSEDKSAIK